MQLLLSDQPERDVNKVRRLGPHYFVDINTLKGCEFDNPFWPDDPPAHLLVLMLAYKIVVSGIDDKPEHVDPHSRTVSAVTQVGDPSHVNKGSFHHRQIS